MMSDASPPDPANRTMGDSSRGRQEREERKMRRSADDRARSDLMRRLSETGEKDRLRDVLRAKLIECGWRSEMKELCRDAIRSRGLQKITVDELVADVLPKGRAAVPDGIRSELLRDVRDFAKRDRDRSNLEYR